jgi:hypothetical protein
MLIVWYIEAFAGGRLAVGCQHHRPEVWRQLVVSIAAHKTHYYSVNSVRQ